MASYGRRAPSQSALGIGAYAGTHRASRATWVLAASDLRFYAGGPSRFHYFSLKGSAAGPGSQGRVVATGNEGTAPGSFGQSSKAQWRNHRV
jgi:hypothetical protein